MRRFAELFKKIMDDKQGNRLAIGENGLVIETVFGAKQITGLLLWGSNIIYVTKCNN